MIKRLFAFLLAVMLSPIPQVIAAEVDTPDVISIYNGNAMLQNSFYVPKFEDIDTATLSMISSGFGDPAIIGLKQEELSTRIKEAKVTTSSDLVNFYKSAYSTNARINNSTFAEAKPVELSEFANNREIQTLGQDILVLDEKLPIIKKIRESSTNNRYTVGLPQIMLPWVYDKEASETKLPVISLAPYFERGEYEHFDANYDEANINWAPGIIGNESPYAFTPVTKAAYKGNNSALAYYPSAHILKDIDLTSQMSRLSVIPMIYKALGQYETQTYAFYKFNPVDLGFWEEDKGTREGSVIIFSTRNKLAAYIAKAMKDRIIDPMIYNASKIIESGKSLSTHSAEYIQNAIKQAADERLTYRQFLNMLRTLMEIYGEPVISEYELKLLMQVYGKEIPFRPNELNTLDVALFSYFRARGITTGAEKFDDYVTLKDVLTILMRVKDINSRQDLKKVQPIIQLNSELIERGYYPKEIRLKVQEAQGTGDSYLSNKGDFKTVDKYDDEVDYIVMRSNSTKMFETNILDERTTSNKYELTKTLVVGARYNNYGSDYQSWYNGIIKDSKGQDYDNFTGQGHYRKGRIGLSKVERDDNMSSLKAAVKDSKDEDSISKAIISYLIDVMTLEQESDYAVFMDWLRKEHTTLYNKVMEMLRVAYFKSYNRAANELVIEVRKPTVELISLKLSVPLSDNVAQKYILSSGNKYSIDPTGKHLGDWLVSFTPYNNELKKDFFIHRSFINTEKENDYPSAVMLESGGGIYYPLLDDEYQPIVLPREGNRDVVVMRRDTTSNDIGSYDIRIYDKAYDTNNTGSGGSAYLFGSKLMPLLAVRGFSYKSLYDSLKGPELNTFHDNTVKEAAFIWAYLLYTTENPKLSTSSIKASFSNLSTSGVNHIADDLESAIHGKRTEMQKKLADDISMHINLIRAAKAELNKAVSVIGSSTSDLLAKKKAYKSFATEIQKSEYNPVIDLIESIFRSNNVADFLEYQAFDYNIVGEYPEDLKKMTPKGKYTDITVSSTNSSGQASNLRITKTGKNSTVPSSSGNLNAGNLTQGVLSGVSSLAADSEQPTQDATKKYIAVASLQGNLMVPWSALEEYEIVPKGSKPIITGSKAIINTYNGQLFIDNDKHVIISGNVVYKVRDMQELFTVSITDNNDSEFTVDIRAILGFSGRGYDIKYSEGSGTTTQVYITKATSNKLEPVYSASYVNISSTSVANYAPVGRYSVFANVKKGVEFLVLNSGHSISNWSILQGYNEASGTVNTYLLEATNANSQHVSSVIADTLGYPLTFPGTWHVEAKTLPFRSGLSTLEEGKIYEHPNYGFIYALPKASSLKEADELLSDKDYQGQLKYALAKDASGAYTIAHGYRNDDSSISTSSNLGSDFIAQVKPIPIGLSYFLRPKDSVTPAKVNVLSVASSLKDLALIGSSKIIMKKDINGKTSPYYRTADDQTLSINLSSTELVAYPVYTYIEYGTNQLYTHYSIVPSDYLLPVSPSDKAESDKLAIDEQRLDVKIRQSESDFEAFIRIAKYNLEDATVYISLLILYILPIIFFALSLLLVILIYLNTTQTFSSIFKHFDLIKVLTLGALSAEDARAKSVVGITIKAILVASFSAMFYGGNAAALLRWVTALFR